MKPVGVISKSPAGIFTEATLPYDKIHEELSNDTLNAVKLTFTNYNQESNKYKFSMSAPETVLLLRKKTWILSLSTMNLQTM